MLYLSVPMKEWDNFYQLVKEIINSRDHYVPILNDPLAMEKDILYLDKATVVLAHMPYPSIGVSMEIAYAHFVKKVPIVGYRCINHLWLDKILLVNCWDLECLKKYLESF
jgi:hypothetical protein